MGKMGMHEEKHTHTHTDWGTNPGHFKLHEKFKPVNYRFLLAAADAFPHSPCKTPAAALTTRALVPGTIPDTLSLLHHCRT